MDSLSRVLSGNNYKSYVILTLRGQDYRYVEVAKGSFGEFTIVAIRFGGKRPDDFVTISVWPNLSREKTFAATYSETCASYSTQAIFYSVLRLKYLIKIFSFIKPRNFKFIQ